MADSNHFWSPFLLSAPNELLDGTAADTTPWTGTAIGGGGEAPCGRFLGANTVSLGQSTNASFWMSVFGQPKAFTSAMFGVSEELTASSAVTEIDPAGMGSVLALIGAALGLLERRRPKAS